MNISFVASPLMKYAFFASLDEINGIDVASDVGDNLCNVENDVKRRFFYIVAFFITSILICTLF